MKTPLIKICGIREYEHAEVAAEAGANLIGFVFVPVRREVSPDAAKQIIEQVRKTIELPPAAVGLFVNETAEHINRIAGQVGLDLVQLSGDEPPEMAAEIEVPVIKAIRVQQGTSIDDVRALIQRYLECSAAVLIDSHVAGQWGGTGMVGDWNSAARLASEFPVVLAGGLNGNNVAEAIDRVKPAGVDVSSGVETEGRKDAGKIRQFISASMAGQTEIESTSNTYSFVELITDIQEKRTASRV
jgi:phosphoribosylanthranilate isomerase